MKNVRPEQLKTVIFMDCSEYEDVLFGIFGDIRVHYDTDGLWYDQNNGENDIDDEMICDVLADYFGVKQITSIHADDCYYTGIWITYINK